MELSCSVGVDENCAVVMKNSIEVPQKKLKVGLSYDPAIPLLSIYPKEMKSELQMDVYYNYIYLKLYSKIMHHYIQKYKIF